MESGITWVRPLARSPRADLSRAGDMYDYQSALNRSNKQSGIRQRSQAIISISRVMCCWAWTRYTKNQSTSRKCLLGRGMFLLRATWCDVAQPRIVAKKKLPAVSCSSYVLDKARRKVTTSGNLPPFNAKDLPNSANGFLVRWNVRSVYHNNGLLLREVQIQRRSVS